MPAAAQRDAYLISWTRIDRIRRWGVGFFDAESWRERIRWAGGIFLVLGHSDRHALLPWHNTERHTALQMAEKWP